MKALAVRQPWAGLIVKGIKDVECRGWSTKYRGPLLIQSAARMTAEAVDDFDVRTSMPGYDYPMGVLLGSVDLVDIVTEHESKWAEPGYSRYFVLENAREFAHPIPWKGVLGLYDVPDEVAVALM